jgi:hypothetical protein
MNTGDLSSLVELVKSYLHSQVSGNELVRYVDDLVGDNVVLKFPDKVRALVNSFQNELAHYVTDEQTRLEAPEVYFRDDELKKKAESFLRELKKEGIGV